MAKLPKVIVKVDPWREAHKELLEALTDVGKKFPKYVRLETFKLWIEINKLPDSSQKDRCVRALEIFTELKRRGLEPRHQNGKYY